MKVRRRSNVMGIIATLAYAVMVMVNFMANALPINGLNTGEVSDSFPNLFAPAGITFAIWAVIYLLLAIYLFFQFVRLTIIITILIIGITINHFLDKRFRYHEIDSDFAFIHYILAVLILILNAIALAALVI